MSRFRALILTVTLGTPLVARAEINAVSKVTAHAEGAKTIIVVHGSATPSFTAYRLERPPRIVVDLADGRVLNADGPMDVDTWAVGQIALAQYSDDSSRTARVMIGFKRASSYDVAAKGHDVVITIIPDERPPADQLAAEMARAQKSRVEAELAKKQAVAERQQAVDDRRQAMDDRQKAVDDRRVAEAAQKKAQAQVGEAEARRSEVEAQLKTAEGQRAQAQQTAAQLQAETQKMIAARAEADRALKTAESAQKLAERARVDEEARLKAVREARAEEERRAKKQVEGLKAEEEANLRAEAARRDADQARARAQAAQAELAHVGAQKKEEQARLAELERKTAEAGQHGAAEAQRLRSEQERQQAKLTELRAEAEQLAQRRSEEAKKLSTIKVEEARRLTEAQADARRVAEQKTARAEEAQAQAARRVEASEAARLAEERKARAQAEEAARLHAAAEVQKKLDAAEEAIAATEKRAQKASQSAEAEQARLESMRAESQKLMAASQSARAEVERQRAESARLFALQETERARVEAARLEARGVADQRAQEAQRAAHAAAMASASKTKMEAAERDARRIAELSAQESVRLEAARAEAQTVAERRQVELKRLEAARAEAQELTGQREAELKRLSEVRLQEQAQIAAARHDVARLSGDVKALEREKLASQAALQEGARNRGQLETERAALAQKVARARAQLSELEQEASGAKSRLEGEKSRLESEKNRLASEKSQLEGQKNRLTSEKSQLEGQKDRLASENGQLEGQKNRLASEKSQLEGQKDRLASEKSQLEGQKDRLASEKSQLEGQKDRLASEKSQLESEKSRLESERAALEQRLVGAREQLRKLEAEARSKLALVPTPARMAAPAKEAAPKVEPVVAKQEKVVTLVRDVRFTDSDDAERVIVDVAGDPQCTVLKSDGRTAVLRITGVALPKKLERTLDAAAYQGPVKTVSTYKDPDEAGAVRVVVALADGVTPEPKLVRDNGQVSWEFPRAATAAKDPQKVDVTSHSYSPERVSAFGASIPLQLVQATPLSLPNATRRHHVYNGRRIDLDFTNYDIHNMLRLISDVGQVNIVTADDVKGTVTIRMRDVPWDQALEVILKAKGLGMQREGNLIRVAPTAVLEKEVEQEVARAKAAVELKPIETRLIPLSYAEGPQMLPRVGDVLSPRGKVSVDVRTNMLIVSDVASNIALAEDLVHNLDTQTPEVSIEARIVEASTTFLRDIGIQWGGGGIASAATGNPTGIAFPSTIGVAGGAVDTLTNSNGILGGQAASPNYVVNMPAAVGTGSGGALGLTLGSVAGNVNINLRLSALENTGSVRIVSSPKITTVDNVEAAIEQGTAIPISVVSAAGTNTVFVDAKLNLTVKPHVTNEGSVIMNIAITRNEPDFVNTSANGTPTILKKQAKTEMLVRDGDTAVIGGIFTRNTGLSYTKVPWFADIPILGWLFKNRRESDDRSELLIFITPRIVKSAATAHR